MPNKTTNLRNKQVRSEISVLTPEKARQAAERLGLPWRDYIGMSRKKCIPINWIKELCLIAAKTD
jgi:hypothetical protein